jgi:hypothetical protein
MAAESGAEVMSPMLTVSRKANAWLFVGVSLVGMIPLGVTGCGGGDYKPELGLVTGTVTISGKPAPDLIVTFEPQQNKDGGKASSIVGGVSTATTNAEGKFDLQYKGTSTKGAVVGPHLVRIQSAAGGGPAGGASAAAIIQIPPQYNSQTKLKADVTAGKNEPMEFDLPIGKK